jgi:L-threonylcarbamoyladenylate synthase
MFEGTPSIRIASAILHQGGVIAYPTEAVWGLGCDPFNATAVFNLLALKKRLPQKGVILVAATLQQFDFILSDLPTPQYELLQQSWPGPITWLVPNNGTIPYWISGDHNSVALRVSAHPLVNALCRAYGGPIVSTSANPQSKPAAKTACKVRQ